GRERRAALSAVREDGFRDGPLLHRLRGGAGGGGGAAGRVFRRAGFMSDAMSDRDDFRESYLKDIRGSAGGELAGKRIVLAISGSIAAVECPRLARELMRRGADVWVCMTPSAAALVTPTAMQWCTGNPVVTELTGWVEHLF